MFSPARCLKDKKGNEAIQVLLVPQDRPALQEQPREMAREGSPDPEVRKDHRDVQVHLEFLGKMDSL